MGFINQRSTYNWGAPSVGTSEKNTGMWMADANTKRSSNVYLFLLVMWWLYDDIHGFSYIMEYFP